MCSAFLFRRAGQQAMKGDSVCDEKLEWVRPLIHETLGISPVIAKTPMRSGPKPTDSVLPKHRHLPRMPPGFKEVGFEERARLY